MASKFLFIYSWLNLFSFFPDKREMIKDKIELAKIEAMEFFKYKKNKDRYCNKAKLYN